MVKLRTLARWSGREDLALALPDGREIPAVRCSGTGNIYLRDGHGQRHVISWRWHQDREWWVLDFVEGRRFASLWEAVRHLISLGGAPIPEGRVAIVGQVGGQLLYGSSPSE